MVLGTTDTEMENGSDVADAVIFLTASPKAGRELQTVLNTMEGGRTLSER